MAVMAQFTFSQVDYTTTPPTVWVAVSYSEPVNGNGYTNASADQEATGLLTTAGLRAAVLAAINTQLGSSYVDADLQLHGTFA